MLVNRIIELLILPFGDLLLDSKFMNELRAWRKIQKYTIEEIQTLETSRLGALLLHASKNIAHYKSLNVVSLLNDPNKWLAAFPVLYKKDIKGMEADFIFGEKNKLIKETSSGSSGIQGEVYMSKQEVSSTQAIQTFIWEWAGYKLGTPLLQLGMTTKRGFVKRMKDVILRTNYQQAFDLNKEEVNKALSSISSNNYFFGGYASGLYAYSLYAEKSIQFKAVISWGDKMFDHYRKNIEKTFQTKVYDTYGCTEGFVIAGQCEERNYHVLSPHIKLELLNEQGQEVAPGELGYVVVTRLDGFSMPLIRYYLGDLAIKEDPTKICGCGRNFPMLKQIVGRDTDIVKTRSGRMLIVHFFTGILEHFPAIKQFRIVQEHLDGFVLEYIPEPDLFEMKILNDVQEIIESKINEEIKIEFLKVDEIKPTASGKPQIIKSLLK